jgi:hypothetical protein
MMPAKGAEGSRAFSLLDNDPLLALRCTSGAKLRQLFLSLYFLSL